MQVPIPHIYQSQMLQMPNSSGSQTCCIDRINAKGAAKPEELNSLLKEKWAYKTVKERVGKPFQLTAS